MPYGIIFLGDFIMIDTHAHLGEQYYDDVGKVLDNAKEAGITKVLAIGANFEDSK